MSHPTAAQPPSPFLRRTDRVPGVWSRTDGYERAFALGLALHLNTVLWIGGGTLLWAEWTSLIFGITLFAFAALAYSTSLPAPDRPLRRLARFPFFWIGLALLAYVAIQAHNIAWERVQVGSVTGMRPVEGAIHWLPQGFVTPLEQENPFRWMLRLLPAWLAACALWMGLRGRAGAYLVASLLAGTLVAWALVAYYQAFTGATHMLGIWEVRSRSPNEPARFWGTFVNRNHGALMMTLGQALLLSLFLRHTRRRFEARGQIMGPAFLLLPLALLMAAGVVMIMSRGGLVILALFYAFFLLVSTLALVRWVGWKGLVLPVVTVALLLAATAAVLQNPDTWNRLQSRLDQMERVSTDMDAEARVWVNRIARDMINDQPRFGWGAGGWRYFYAPYLIYYPEFRAEMSLRPRDPATGEYLLNERGRPVWRRVPIWYRQAHNDWLEVVVELGYAGASLVFLGMGIWGIWILVVGWRDPALLMLAAGPTGLLAAAAWEFHLRIPAPLLWTSVLMVLPLLFAQRSRESRQKRRRAPDPGKKPAETGGDSKGLALPV